MGAIPGLLAAALAGCSDYDLVRMAGDDVFYQREASAVDVLLVVDNSGSMQPYQEKLSQDFDRFLTFFLEGDVDYHIGVVTTTVADVEPWGDCTQDDIDALPEPGHLVGGTFITPDTEGAEQVFADIVQVGTCGSGYEMGLEAARLALAEPLSSGANAGFLRDDAYLSVIFVSDEQDSSPRPVPDYVNGFFELKGQRNRDIFNASALVVTDVGLCSASQVASGAVEGTRYVDMAEWTGGMTGNICADDFGTIVEDLSLASSRLADTFELSELPDPATLVVGVDGEEVPCESGEWTYELDEREDGPVGLVVFDRAHLPPPSARITVNYDLGDGDPAAFCPEAGR